MDAAVTMAATPPTLEQDDAEGFIARGDAELDASRTEAALRWYSAAAALDAADFEAWTSAGDALSALGRHASAAASYQRAAAADPSDADLPLLRAKALTQCGAHAEAAEAIDAALAILGAQPDADREAVADAWTLRGNAAFNDCRTTEALRCYDAALDVLPEHEWSARVRHHAAARQHCEEAAAAADAAAADADGVVLAPLEVYRTLALPEREGYARNPLWATHLLHWLDAASCAKLVFMAEEHAAAQGGWSAKRHADNLREDGVSTATFDFEVTEAAAIWAWVAPRVHAELLPTMFALFFENEETEQSELLLRELFFVKYEAAEEDEEAAVESATKRAGLPLHRDGYLMSFNILLSRPDDELRPVATAGDFAGGGTRLETLGACACPARIGDVFMHSGRMLHGADPVTRGTRYIIVGFVEAVSRAGTAAAAAAAAAARTDGWAALHAEPPDVGGEVDYATLRKEWRLLIGEGEKVE